MSTSGFVSEYNENGVSRAVETSDAIDFSVAERLPDGGTTCKCYKTVLDGHTVFVKRLKPELANKASYREAFRKEFETGSRLHHPSLPDYRRFFGDYIVMDYVDGFTIADLVDRNDEWLANEDNVRKMMQELLDVIDYLHQHNIVHCDIKVDNVMITAGTRNVMLIDLDKCYNYVHNKRLSGTTSNFGLDADKLGDPLLDFRGLAKILEYLKRNVKDFPWRQFSRFAKECNKAETSLPMLRIELEPIHFTTTTKAGVSGYFLPFSSPVDFDNAIHLSWKSDVCDYYRISQNLHYFVVKRIKDSLITEALSGLSLKKDYESICAFNHPCLPRYFDFKILYIIMDNVVGDTLDELIERQDERLRDAKFVRQFLSELVDAIDYLHKRSVVHSRIYARDILITYEATIARLLNFELSHTLSHPGTVTGNPEELGMPKEAVGDRRLDYRGLGRIAIHMKKEVKGFPKREFNRFIKACFSENATITTLQKALKPRWWRLW